MNYGTFSSEQIANALNEVSHRRAWKYSLRTIRQYIEDPEKVTPNNTPYSNKVLIEFGRNYPDAYGKLEALVYRIHHGDASEENYSEARKARLQEAMDFVKSAARPARYLDSIRRHAAGSEPWDSCFTRGKKILNELVALARSNPVVYACFEDDVRSMSEKRHTEKRNGYIKDHAKRKQAIMDILGLIHPEGVTRKHYEEALADRTRQRDAYILRNLRDGITKKTLQDEFYKLYDEELFKTQTLARNVKKSGTVLRGKLSLPSVVRSDNKSFKQREPLNNSIKEQLCQSRGRTRN